MGLHPRSQNDYLEVPRAGKDGVKAGGLAASRRSLDNVLEGGDLFLADEPGQAPRGVVRLNQETRCIRVVPLRTSGATCGVPRAITCVPQLGTP
jgi:hypothetical protein